MACLPFCDQLLQVGLYKYFSLKLQTSFCNYSTTKDSAASSSSGPGLQRDDCWPGVDWRPAASPSAEQALSGASSGPELPVVQELPKVQELPVVQELPKVQELPVVQREPAVQLDEEDDDHQPPPPTAPLPRAVVLASGRDAACLQPMPTHSTHPVIMCVRCCFCNICELYDY
jgi:hypothetical protein